MRNSSRRYWLKSVVGAWVVALAFGTVALAGESAPRVLFDMSYTAECRDVTPEGFLATHRGLRIVEAKFRISTRLESGRESDLEQLLIEITGMDRDLPVVDFMPRTELDTDIAGEIEVVDNKERTESTNAGVIGTVGVEYGIVKAQASPSIGGGNTRASGTKETYKRIPPKQLLLASGTINRGNGVFFKLKPSSQASLEGVRDFACLFLVPADWTGQSVRVRCQARSLKKSYFTTKLQSSGAAEFFVGLFLEGSTGARAAADELARAQVAGAVRDTSSSSKSSLSLAAFKPLVNQAVDVSKTLFVCPLPGKHEPGQLGDAARIDAAEELSDGSSRLADALESLNRRSGNRMK